MIDPALGVTIDAAFGKSVDAMPLRGAAVGGSEFATLCIMPCSPPIERQGRFTRDAVTGAVVRHVP